MEQENIRYRGPSTVRHSYMSDFVVECPKCSHDARVTVDNPWSKKNGKLACSNCAHTEHVEDRIRYNLIVNRHCDNCGKRIEIKVPNKKQKEDKLTVPCPYCNIVRTYNPRNEVTRLVYQNTGKACDPIFNLPLWFQIEIKGNLFWAYNREHLMEIKKYVRSKLRERQTTTHTTMVEKLPNFIKDAKNREALLKGIEKLEKKA